MSVLGRNKIYFAYFCFSFLFISFTFFSLIADAAQSSNYHLVETSLGGTGQLNSSSASYQVQQSGGIIGVGTSKSSGSGGGDQVKAGHETTNDPALSFEVINANVSFGSFSPTSTAVTTSTFAISNYTSYGYIVQIFGTPPTNAYGYKIKEMTANGASIAGTEQYGINLVANTQPQTFGADPNFGQFGNGSIATNYNTANSFRFDSGDEIASAGKSSGKTTYTISYIVNVSPITPGGQYTATQNIVVTGTY